ncbi:MULTISPECIES: fimbria biosynthesis transcriptional regulator FimW [Cedecea]|jgi:fimbrial protein FimW|uniref:Fimbriae regulatory protein FimW n=1 Tax=Cedecea neteri TaxID=158822 RepID=A0A089Q6C0_9ENTR|nr:MULTISPECIES: fimbria biosynthesis transcriptional regulator FimW [Cedecea]AIR05959.1 fimbriae regulatory protein FimW [Cedecea neteri]NWC62643.1 fimbria biosynthesis transcriptional regulator FimW [Cedecea sp. P7760]
MLTVAICERNSHFANGIKIIIQQLCRQFSETYHFLPLAHQDVADLVFFALDDNWSTANCYKIPQTTRHQRVILICRKQDQENLMFRPCLYMLPSIYREDEVEDVRLKLAPWVDPERRRKNTLPVPTSICHYCTTRHFNLQERELLKLMACGYSLVDAAFIMHIDENVARDKRLSIMKKLNIKNQYKLMNYIKLNLPFLLD